MTYQSPVANIISSDKQDEIVQTILTLDQTPSAPIAPASLYDLEGRRAKILDLHKLTRQADNLLTFETYGNGNLVLTAGSTYSFTIWWTPDQLEIAQDTSRHWHKQSFAPKDMMLFKGEGGQIGRQVAEGEIIGEGRLVKGGWDHEHCSLCWQKIAAYEGELHDGYTDGRQWLCETCYTTYIGSGLGEKLGEQVQ